MKITLFEIFGIKIRSYGLMIAIGISVALLLLDKQSKKMGYNEDDIWGLFLWSILSGVLGGKILWIITEFKTVKENPKILLNIGYGFVVYGAIGGGALAICIYCLRKKWNVLKVFDMVAPLVAIAQGFGRIGCLLAGCCYGAPTHSHLGIVFPDGSMAPSGIRLHPTQIYSSIFDFILGILLFWYFNKKPKEGKVFGAYMILYSIGRFLVEFLRNDPRGNVGNFSTSQFIAIFTLILGICMFNIHKFKKVKNN